jgi:hypothetical protein
MNEYDVDRQAATTCVSQAWSAVRFFGATADEDMIEMAAGIARRELRLRLGLEREIARLDPEDHRRPPI